MIRQLHGIGKRMATGAALAVFAVSAGSQQPASNPATTATNAFALDLYHQLTKDKDNDGKNLWFSPYSITSALAMTAEGAHGDTLAQMAKTLQFSDSPQAAQLLPIHEGMAALNRQFESGEAAPYQLVVANAIWGDQKYPFDQKYVDTIRKYYAAAGIFPVDFLHDAEAARSRINNWVETQTRQKIMNLLPEHSIDAMTRLVLTNAVYFKGAWVNPFNPFNVKALATRPQPFHLEAARTVSAPLMQGGGDMPYMENDLLQAVSLPFKGRTATDHMTMIVILPKKVDGLAEVEKSLSGASLGAWISALSSRPVQIFLPKFKMTNQLNLDKTLATMGMPDAFNASRADFSGMSPDAIMDQLHISHVLHKAYLAVDENGAEAAAATAVEMLVGSAAPEDPPRVFRADHPFLVLLRHNPSGTILFLGRVMNPVAQ